MQKTMCAGCLQMFNPARENQIYCSDACKQKGYRARKRMFSVSNLHRKCEHCGKYFWQQRGGRTKKYCSDSCRTLAYRKSRAD